MVWNCCVCKLSQGVIEDISFHRILKSEDQKAKWTEALGKELKKSHSVCSIHFEESDLQYKIYGNSVKRFLKPNSVPTVLLDQNYENILENKEKKRKVSAEDSTTLSSTNDIQYYNKENNDQGNNCIYNSSSSEPTNIRMKIH